MSKDVIKNAFIKSIPIMCSYIFVSMAYGIMMQNAGFGWLYSLTISLTVYTGAFQFVLVTLLSSTAGIVTIAITAFLMNSRQSFYALTYIDEFKKMGNRELYMIHTMTDETYALNCSIVEERNVGRISEDVSRQEMFLIALFSRCYWMAGAVAGGIIGQIIPFDLTGIDFCMTALFVIIFIDQWERTDNHIPAIVGIVVGIISLICIGKTYFLLVALIVSSALLIMFNESSLMNGKKDKVRNKTE